MNDFALVGLSGLTFIRQKLAVLICEEKRMALEHIILMVQ